MAYFDNIKVGDEVIDIVTGEVGKIVEFGNDTIYPIVVDFGTYTIDGKRVESNRLQRLYYKGYEPTITVPEPPKKEYKFKSFEWQYTITTLEVLSQVDGHSKRLFLNGLYRHTREQAEASLERNRKANRLEMLVYDIQDEVGGDYYIYRKDDKWEYCSSSISFYPEVVYMDKDTAEKICEILNNEEYEL